MRTSNISNYVNAKLNMGAKSYHVLSDPDCCGKCEDVYKGGKQWFDIDDMTYFPPRHTNCRCVPAFSTKTHVENIGEYNATVGKSNYLNSLSEKEIKYYNSLSTTIPKLSQRAHLIYSLDSTIANNFLSLPNKEFMKIHGLEGWTIHKVQQHVNNLKKTWVFGKEDMIVFKGFGQPNVDVGRVNSKGIFISTSIDEAIAIGYTRGNGDHIPIKLPKEVPRIYIIKYSEYPNHMEILIPPEYYIHEYIVNNKIFYEFRKRK